MRPDAPRVTGSRANTDADRVRAPGPACRHSAATDPLAQSMVDISSNALSCGSVQELLNRSVRTIAAGLAPSHCLLFELTSGQRTPKRCTAIGWERVTRDGVAACAESIGGGDFRQLTSRVDDERGEFSKFLYRQRIAPSGTRFAGRDEDPHYGLLVARRYGTTWLGIIAGSHTPRDGYRATSVAFLKAILDMLLLGVDRINRAGDPAKGPFSPTDRPSNGLASWGFVLPYEADAPAAENRDALTGWGEGQADWAGLRASLTNPFDATRLDFGAGLLAAREEERKRIARELHDGVNQRLFFVKLSLDRVRGSLGEDFPVPERAALDSAAQETKNAIDEIRGIAAEAKSPSIDGGCLVTGLRRLCAEFERVLGGSRVELETNLRHSTIDESLMATIFRITQEALHNAAKYSGAAGIVVGLFVRDNRIYLTIRDDGRGFDCSDLAGRDLGSGIRGMQERVESSGGFLLVTSQPSGGTAIEAGWPLAGFGAASMSSPASTAEA